MLRNSQHLWLPAQDLHKIKTVDPRACNEEGAPEPLLATQELWRVDSVLGREDQFSLRVAMSQRRELHVQESMGLGSSGVLGVQGEGVDLGGDVEKCGGVNLSKI